MRYKEINTSTKEGLAEYKRLEANGWQVHAVQQGQVSLVYEDIADRLAAMNKSRGRRWAMRLR